MAIFDQFLATYQERCKVGTWNARRNYALCRMALFLVTLSDNYQNHPNFEVISTFCIGFHRVFVMRGKGIIQIWQVR